MVEALEERVAELSKYRQMLCSCVSQCLTLYGFSAAEYAGKTHSMLQDVDLIFNCHTDNFDNKIN